MVRGNMPRRMRIKLAFCGLVLAAGCSGFDKNDAAMQVRERFCNDWPYGCTDSTRVVVDEVHKTNRGRQVEFRVVDREDETTTLSSAYFEPEDNEWSFLFFENPFKDRFQEEATRVSEEIRLYGEQLRELKASQNWFLSIYGRYANSLEELDSVSYKPGKAPIALTAANGKEWKAEISSRFVKCQFDGPRQQLPACVGLPAENAGTESGPLSETFGETP
jgi:hypothetical protein